MSCPSPARLERGYWSDDRAIAAHVDGCARCGAAWREIGALRRLGESLPAPPPTTRGEELRTALVTRRAEEKRRRRSLWPWLLPVAATAAALLLVWPSRPAEKMATDSARPQVLARGEARYLTGDGWVRLVDGALTVSAPVVLLIGEGRVEVSDGVADVLAENDRLLAVRVWIGSAELHDPSTPVVVRAGETWRAPVTVAVDAGLVEPPPPIVPRPRPAPVHLEAAPVDAGLPPVDAAPIAIARRGPASDAYDAAWEAIRAGDFLTAERRFLEVIRLADDPALREDARYWRAVALARATQVSQAIAAFEAFLIDFPASPHRGEASVALAWLLLERGDRIGARERFQAAAGDVSPRVRASAAEGLAAVDR